MGAIYGTFGNAGAVDDEEDEPSPRNDAERIDWILQRLTKPVDTPAVTPWGDQPEDFDQVDKPSRIDTQAMAPIYEKIGFAPDGTARSMADWLTQTIASLPRDPAAKIRVFARSRFPDLPPDEALARYGVMGDRIFYIDRDGSAKWEEPSIRNLLDSPMRYASSLAGPSMAPLGAAAGGAVGGVPGAAAGAGASDALRQALAAALAHEQMSPAERSFNLALEAGAGAGGRYVGNRVAAALASRTSLPAYATGAFVQYGARKAANKLAFKAGRAIENLWPERNDPEEP